MVRRTFEVIDIVGILVHSRTFPHRKVNAEVMSTSPDRPARVVGP